ALNVASGVVISQFHAKHRSQEFLKFQSARRHCSSSVRRRNSSHFRQLRAHKTPRVKRWLLKHPYPLALYSDQLLLDQSGRKTICGDRTAKAPRSEERRVGNEGGS